MTLTFPYPVKADITDEMTLPSIVLSYGDGCKQRSPDGLNLPKTVWNIQCPLDSKAKGIALKAFLINVGNSIPFLWQSPLDTKPEFYYITGKIGGSYRLGGASKPDFFVRTMQFEYANIVIVPLTPIPIPIPIPIPTPVASITGATEATGFTLSISNVSLTNINFNLARTFTVYYTALNPTYFTATIPAGSLSINIPFGSRNQDPRFPDPTFGNVLMSLYVGNGYVQDSIKTNAYISFP